MAHQDRVVSDVGENYFSAGYFSKGPLSSGKNWALSKFGVTRDRGLRKPGVRNNHIIQYVPPEGNNQRAHMFGRVKMSGFSGFGHKVTKVGLFGRRFNEGFLNFRNNKIGDNARVKIPGTDQDQVRMKE